MNGAKRRVMKPRSPKPGQINLHSEARNPQSTSRNRQFFKQVYAVVRTIPRGRVLTYGQIAAILGSPYMARQVGWAMHGCPKGLPWQRVVGAGGKILINSMSAGGPLLQRKLLELEGVLFAGKRVDMAEHQFVPPHMRKMGNQKTLSSSVSRNKAARKKQRRPSGKAREPKRRGTSASSHRRQ